MIGGIETVVRDLAFHMNHRGIVADVMDVSPRIKERRKDHLDESAVWRVPLRPNRLVGITPPIRSVLVDYDLLHVHDPQLMALSANILAQGRGKKKVLSTHGGFFHTSNYSGIKKLHWRVFASTILRQYDEVLASSEADRDAFKSKVSNVKLVPNGVNISRFSSVERREGLPATRWIYWGRFSQNKRFDLLVDTVKHARDSGIDVTLSIAGRDFDGLLPSIRSRIAGHGLNEHIRVLGPLSDSDLLTELAAHTVFITASEYEGFGLSVVEAMAAGLIVICRDMAPLNSFVVSSKNGVTIGFDSGAADIAAIRALCSASVEEVSAMQKCARASSIPHSWDTIIEKYIAVYDEVLRRDP